MPKLNYLQPTLFLYNWWKILLNTKEEVLGYVVVPLTVSWLAAHLFVGQLTAFTRSFTYQLWSQLSTHTANHCFTRQHSQLILQLEDRLTSKRALFLGSGSLWFVCQDLLNPRNQLSKQVPLTGSLINNTFIFTTHRLALIK